MAKVIKKNQTATNTDAHINPETQIKKVKISAQEVLKTAKEQEKAKLKEGYHFIALDPKTLVLRKTI